MKNKDEGKALKEFGETVSKARLLWDSIPSPKDVESKKRMMIAIKGLKALDYAMYCSYLAFTPWDDMDMGSKRALTMYGEDEK